MTITIAVAGRIATATATTQVVAGNTYPVAVSLDSEWTGNLFMRVRFGSLYYDIPFASTDTAVNVQFPVGYPEVGIGIFSEALQVCTSEVRVRLLRSILEAGEQVVEFDGDLYDQWAGEVTTLLTDDAFDAESTRPVQNATITAWKGTVALDADVVHKAGAETVTGAKTFTASPVVQSVTPAVNLTSSQAHDASADKAILTVYDQKDGANSAQSQIISKTASGYEQIAIRASTPNRQSNYEVVNRAFSDHQLVMVTAPYYPVDGQGNPQALTANALVASGNIAVDPRLVHTTGNEIVAGNKTFTGTVDAYPGGWHATAKAMTVGQYCVFARINPANLGNGHFHFLDFIQSSNTSTAYGRMVFKANKTGPEAVWAWRKTSGGNSPLGSTDVVILADDSTIYLAWKKSNTYGNLVCREVMDINYGGPQALGGASNVQFYAQADMTVLDNLSGYTVFEVAE